MNHCKKRDIIRVWKIFEDKNQWFPHVRKSHIENRIDRKQVILQDGVLITYQINKHNRKIGRDTDVAMTKGSYLIHQIVNENQGNGMAEKVIKDFFAYVGTDVYLTVRKENIAANKFYEKVGMEKVGTISWSDGKMPGVVWKKSGKHSN